MENVNIFFDTNSIKKIDCKLDVFEFNESYEIIKSFIIENEFDNIKVFIPRIVIDELIQQYSEDYKKVRQSIDSKLLEISKDINRMKWDIVINKTFNYTNSDYVKYIREQAEEYLQRERPFLNIVEYPNESKLTKIIERAINKKKPFFGGYSRKKEFSDAGFKDVVFLESVLGIMEELNEVFYVISRDKVFNELNLEKEIRDCKGKVISSDTGKKIVEYFKQELSLNDYSKYIKFVKSEYYKKAIEDAIKCKMIDNYVDITEEEYDNDVYINNTSLVEFEGKYKEIIVKLSEENDFIELIDKETEAVIYEW